MGSNQRGVEFRSTDTWPPHRGSISALAREPRVCDSLLGNPELNLDLNDHLRTRSSYTTNLAHVLGTCADSDINEMQTHSLLGSLRCKTRCLHRRCSKTLRVRAPGSCLSSLLFSCSGGDMLSGRCEPPILLRDESCYRACYMRNTRLPVPCLYIVSDRFRDDQKHRRQF